MLLKFEIFWTGIYQVIRLGHFQKHPTHKKHSVIFLDILYKEN